ncbi:MAG: TIM barrel protein [Candidatus Eremiobacteraeota bacterium]|nr:TIM barrel protein [Candidatus Eremiobacteraeota bacterium]
MKLACTSSAFSGALDRGDLTQLEIIDYAARELSIDGIVLDVRHFPRTDDDYLAQVKKMAADVGLTIAALESSDIFTSDTSTMQRALAMATALGSPLIAAPLGSETALAWSAQLAKLSEAAGLAKAANVTLALRNVPGTFASSVADCKRVSKETDSAWLRYGLEPAAFDASSDARDLEERTVLLWSDALSTPEPFFAAWPSFLGFVVLTGGAPVPEMKNAIRRWRIANAQFVLDRK